MVGDGNLTPAPDSKTSAERRANQLKLYRFGVFVWACVAVVALLVPWPYALVAVLFATFLHFASLDGDTATREYARRKFGR